MNKFKNISTLLLFVVALSFGACTQDDPMDDIMDNTEINSPSPTNNGNGNGDDTDPPCEGC